MVVRRRDLQTKSVAQPTDLPCMQDQDLSLVSARRRQRRSASLGKKVTRDSVMSRELAGPGSPAHGVRVHRLSVVVFVLELAVGVVVAWAISTCLIMEL